MEPSGPKRSSRIPGFYRLSPEERRDALRSVGGVDDLGAFAGAGLALHEADAMVENVIGTFALPNAVAVNFLINGRDVLVPMVVEEPSVVAAVSNMARLARAGGGFFAESDPSIMIGQIQLVDVGDADACEARLRAEIPRLHAIAAVIHPRLIERGGGVRGFEVRRVVYDEPGERREVMVVVHVLVDCRDAMGANMVNTVCEQLAPHLEEITGEVVGLKILSNLADQRLSRARVSLPAAGGGPPPRARGGGGGGAPPPPLS
jgi:hydroxymethylglutaryl-CoA reductase